MAFTKTPMSVEERKQKKREASLRHYWAHHEAVRAQQNARDPEKRRADNRARAAANPERYRGYWRKDAARRRINRPWLSSLRACQKRAQKKGREFTLTNEWCVENYTGRCALTGLSFDTSPTDTPGPRPHSISIDRKDQTKGYTPDNCRFILHGVNAFRGSGSDEQLAIMAKALLSQI